MHPSRRDPLRADVTGAAAAGVVTLHGELDLAGDTRLRQVVGELPPAATLVLVDLRALTFVDCRGLGALLRLRREVRHLGARVVLLVAATGPVARLFALTGLTHLVSILGPASGAQDTAVGRVRDIER